MRYMRPDHDTRLGTTDSQKDSVPWPRILQNDDASLRVGITRWFSRGSGYLTDIFVVITYMNLRRPLT